MQIIRLDDIGSTNDYLLDLASEHPDREVVAVSRHQTDGKGMGTNRWESEKGANILYSMLLHPRWLPVSLQYLLSMAQAVAICEVLSEYTADITIKWPNDIYWRDKKISGTRIDTNIKGGKLGDMVIGTGININQQHFLSDAPNPVSLYQITGKTHDLDVILDKIISAFERYRDLLHNGAHDTIIRLYHDNLYRKEGLHRYADDKGTFMARLVDVLPNGIMRLQRENGVISEYMFKEVQFLQS